MLSKLCDLLRYRTKPGSKPCHETIPDARATQVQGRSAAAPLCHDDRESLSALAASALQAGELEKALELYGRLVELNPDCAEAYFKRGNALNRLGQPEPALADYDRAIKLDPSHAHALCNRGAVLDRLGRRDEALVSYDRAIDLDSTDSLTYYNRASVLKDLRRFEEALASYDKAIEIRKVYVEAFINRGNVLEQLRRYEAAVASFDAAIELDPVYAQAFLGRGISLQKLKRVEQALADFEQAIVLAPNDAALHISRGGVLLGMDRYVEAAASYERAVQVAVTRAEGHYGLGISLMHCRKPDAAIESFDRAMALDPDRKYLLGAHSSAKMQICDWRRFGPDLKIIEDGVRAGKSVCEPHALLGLVDSPELQRMAAETWVREEYPPDTTLGPIPRPPIAEKIRVGYFSSDFCNHPVARLTAGLFEAHDRSKFEIIAFAFGPRSEDALRARLKRAFDRFIDVGEQSDREAAALSREIGIDIAVDLNGHTRYERGGIFAMRAAPIQLSYIGYLGTMGAPYMDYLVADRTIIPPSESPHYLEKIIYLPSYQVNDPQRTMSRRWFSREELGLPPRGFVFSCLNAIYKLLPSTFEMWMRILRRVEDSVLFLYAQNPTAVRNLRVEAERWGVAPQRIVFADKLGVEEYLSRFRTLDLFLDTSPYNAGTTASDALWAGLPVLTCPGRCFASRCAASLLNAVGLPALIAETPEEYEETAVRLALDPSEMSLIRDKLSANRLSAPLFDTGLFARHLESAYRRIYERYQANLTPEHIDP